MIKCTKCNVTIDQCTCPDIDERMHSEAYNPNSHVAMKWCRKCDKHYGRCKCELPDFFLINRGQEMPMPAGGWPTLAGTRVEIDKHKR